MPFARYKEEILLRNVRALKEEAMQLIGIRCMLCGVFVSASDKRHPDGSAAFYNGWPYPCPENGTYLVRSGSKPSNCLPLYEEIWT